MSKVWFTRLYWCNESRARCYWAPFCLLSLSRIGSRDIKKLRKHSRVDLIHIQDNLIDSRMGFKWDILEKIIYIDHG